MTRTIKPEAQALSVYNSLTRQKELFKPIHADRVGLYVCGPTVYSDVHLGNCRTFISFDVMFRYLQHLGFQVRYVRNVTDVGHLEGDSDDHGAEDKIAKRARLEQLEPMEVVQKYLNGFQDMMKILNVLPPSIEPRATGNIVEQIEMVQQILDNGLAYEVNGSVYFDTEKYQAQTHLYGKLSGRVIEELLAESRALKKQDEKRNPADFALWMKAAPEHLLHWRAPWSVGFPGWHLECSAMSTKYLGETFDLHGGGMDLKFPHHENEIAQNNAACGSNGANYWLHANMLLLNGKKMSKSDGNNIMPLELFSGNSAHVSQAYSPMVFRFFTLQSHYASTLDLSDEALQAAEKAYQRLSEAHETLQSLQTEQSNRNSPLDQDIQQNLAALYAEMNDDFNAPKAIAKMFELATKINSLKGGQLHIKELSAETLAQLKTTYAAFLIDIFGLQPDDDGSNDAIKNTLDGVMQMVLDLRKTARTNKDWAMSDRLRDALNELNIVVKDDKEGSTWRIGSAS
jgi:cysteinyl-tRNA synthetase